jgi:hypothetical protein
VLYDLKGRSRVACRQVRIDAQHVARGSDRPLKLFWPISRHGEPAGRQGPCARDRWS